MAQSKLNDLAGRLGGSPRGLGIGLKLLVAVGGAAYGMSQAMYNGTLRVCSLALFSCEVCMTVIVAIIIIIVIF